MPGSSIRPNTKLILSNYLLIINWLVLITEVIYHLYAQGILPSTNRKQKWLKQSQILGKLSLGDKGDEHGKNNQNLMCALKYDNFHGQRGSEERSGGDKAIPEWASSRLP